MLAANKICYQRHFWSLLTRCSFSTAGLERPRVERIITKVDNDVRRVGRIAKNDVYSIFESVKEMGFVQPSHSLVLLRCCGSLLCGLNSEARNELVDEVWSTIKASNMQLNVSHYNALLNVYIENNKLFNPSDLLAEMEGNGIEPNRVTYQRLLHRYCQTGDIQGALKILEHMKSKGLPLSEAIFNSLILGYSRAGDIDACMAVIGQMESSNIEVTNNSFRTLLCSLCENLNKGSDVEEKLNETIKMLEAKDVQMTDKDWLDVVFTIAKLDEKSSLIDMFLQKCKQTIIYHHECFITIMELINEKKLDTALKLLYTMKGSDVTNELKNFGNFFVSHLINTRVDQELVIKICDELYNKGVNIYGYAKAAEAAFEVEPLEKSKFYLKTFLTKTGETCKPHFLWPLLAKCKTDDDVLSILTEDLAPITSTSSFTSLTDTFSDYIWPKVQMDRNIFIERCKELGFTDIVLVSSLLRYKIREDKLDEVVKILNDERYFRKNLTQYITNDLVFAYKRTADIENTISILKKFAATATSARDPAGMFLLELMHFRGIDIERQFVPLVNAMSENNIFISSGTAEIIDRKDILNNKEKKLVKSLVSSSLEENKVSDVFAASIEDLEKQYSDLLSRGILARGTLRQLIMAYCRKQFDTSTEQGKAQLKATRDRIEQLLTELSDSSGSFTKGLRALLMNFYATQCEDLEVALKYKNMDNATLDVPKILNLARLMVSKGKVDDAIKLLNEEDGKERDHLSLIPKGRLDLDIIKLVNIAAEVTKDSEMVKQLLDVAVKFCGIKITHFVLEPVIKVHLLNNNFEKALEEFKYYVETYKCAPANVELMVEALKNDDSQKLQMITDLSNSVQGDHSTLFDLAIALIRCDKIKQAKKVMSTPGLRINERRLKSFSLRYIRENKMHILEQAIPLLKNVFDVNLDELYFDLLQCYAKAGNVEKGHELWTQMQEDNVILSDKTIRFLTTFLGEAGKDISFAIKN